MKAQLKMAAATLISSIAATGFCAAAASGGGHSGGGAAAAPASPPSSAARPIISAGPAQFSHGPANRPTVPSPAHHPGGAHGGNFVVHGVQTRSQPHRWPIVASRNPYNDYWNYGNWNYGYSNHGGYYGGYLGYNNYFSSVDRCFLIPYSEQGYSCERRMYYGRGLDVCCY